jgi:nucleotide-binding universal stress UspA family protein
MNAVMGDWQGPLRPAAPEEAYRVDTVIVPLDGGNLSKSALPVARTLARLEGATLHVLYVGEHLAGPRQTSRELGLTSEELQGAVLTQLAGNPAEMILRFTQEQASPLIVMCPDATEPRPRALLGAVAEGIMSTAPVRIVLVAREYGVSPWTLRRILLAHDGTPTSDAATAPAADLARRAGAEVVALHVAARTTSRDIEPGSLPAPRYIDQLQHEWPAWASQFVQRMMALGAPPGTVNLKLLVTGGQPGSEIAQFARDRNSDLVVMAWHGEWRPRRTGALKTVVYRSGCPVMLICAATVK